jgi:putative ABC transport system permease protein
LRLLHALRARVGLLWGRRAHEARIDDEFRFHLDMETARLVQLGEEPAEARRRALVAFGAADAHREALRDGRGSRVVEEAGRDIRHAVRALARSPAHAAATILTLGVGVGVVTAMFSLVSALLFRPLPFPSSHRLVAIYQEQQETGAGARPVRWSYPEYEVLRAAAAGTVEVAAYNVTDANVVLGGEPRRAGMELVTPSYFSVLGAEPAAGRWFLDERLPDAAADEAAAIVSYRLWHEELGGGAVLGATILVNDVALTVVGVAPRGFEGLSGEVDVWVLQRLGPLVSFAGQLTVAQHFLSVVGRLDAGVELPRAAAALAGVPGLEASAARAERGPADAEWSVRVRLLEEARRPVGAVRARLALMGAVGVLLLIAVVNVTGLMLARSVARQRDVAVRAALGAGRRRLLQQSIAEALVLGLAGGVTGVVLASWSVRVLPALARAGFDRGLPRPLHVSAFAAPSLDWRVLVFAFVLAVGAAVAASLPPAIRSLRYATAGGGVARAGRGFAAAAGSLRRPTLLSSVIVVQVACAVVLLTGAGTLLRAFGQLSARATGVLDEDGLVTFRITPPDSRYAGDAAARLLEQVLDQVGAVPGVVSATVSRCTPFMRCSSTYMYEAGSPETQAPLVGRHYVGPDHFRTLGVPILRGRGLTAADRAGAPLVAVVSETAARQLWPGEDAIGRRVWFGSGRGFDSPDTPTEIVGIAADVLYEGDTPGPEFYTSYLQYTLPSTLVIVRTGGNPAALVSPLRDAVARVDPTLPVHDVRTLAERRSEALERERFATVALAAFASLGVLLVIVGIYGITAYSVAHRRREIAIRVALGARASSVVRLVVGNGAGLIAAGIATGAVASFWFMRILGSLVGTAPGLPLALGAAVPLMLATALLASWLPARRAALIEPRLQLGEE